MIDVNDILKNLYAAYGTVSGILLGIPSDRMPSVKAIIDFTISQMNDRRSFPGDGEEFVRNRCRFGLCRIRPRCINEGLVCAAICQEFLVPNDSLDRPLIIMFDDNPTLIKKAIDKRLAVCPQCKGYSFFEVTG